MALLNAAQLAEVHADIMSKWSRDRTPTPITKAELSSLLSIMDTTQRDAEDAVISAIPGAHPGKQWLIDNQSIARGVLVLIEEKRKESL